MGKREILIPAMGEGIIEATIVRWLKKEGDKIFENEVVLEIATDKVDNEITAPCDGFIGKILFGEGSIVTVGAIVAIISTGLSDAKNNLKSNEIPAPKSVKFKRHIKTLSAENLVMTRTSSGKFISPLVRNIAKENGILPDELDLIKGTAINERISKDDIIKYLKTRNIKNNGPEPINGINVEANGHPNIKGHQIVEMDRVRKLIAEAMVRSKNISPHATSFHEVDVTNLVIWRNKVKSEFNDKYNVPLTYTSLFIEILAHALKEFPSINISVEGTKMIFKKEINIGMATALPSGNLIVPVIRNADQLSLSGLAKKVNDLANRARNNRLQPEEIHEGTFTMTNIGTFGNFAGIPIINQPEVAIIAMGAIKKKPAVIETSDGDQIAIRHQMILSLSFDHRVIDGAIGGAFLGKVGDLLENIDLNRIIQE